MAPPKAANETVERFSRAKAHTTYRLADGTIVPSATTVIGVLGLNKQALIAWAARVAAQGIDPTKYRDEAAHAGSCAHEMVRAYWLGQEADLTMFSAEQITAAENSFAAFRQWAERKQIKPILVEQALVSERYRFGGTVDWYGTLDGIPTLIDLKTSSGIWLEHKIQVSAYRQLLRERGYPVKRVRLLRIGREEGDSFEEHLVGSKELASLWKVFMHAHGIYDLVQQLRRQDHGR